ncbi:MAG: glycosyltransferase family 4 protein, partial [Candidatus Saccharimonadales bacterium]
MARRAPIRTGPVRVLHVINGEEYAGAERVQDSLALRLPDEGFEVGFACLKPRRFAEMRQAVDAPLYELPMRSKFDATPVHRLARLLRDEGYALVHTHTPRTALVGCLAARLARLPLVHHVHCQTAVEVGARRWQDKANLVLERWTTRRASRIIAVSPSLYRYLLRHGYSRQKLRLAPNGVPSRRLPACEAPSLARKTAWTIGAIALFRP